MEGCVAVDTCSLQERSSKMEPFPSQSSQDWEHTLRDKRVGQSDPSIAFTSSPDSFCFASNRQLSIMKYSSSTSHPKREHTPPWLCFSLLWFALKVYRHSSRVDERREAAVTKKSPRLFICSVQRRVALSVFDLFSFRFPLKRISFWRRRFDQTLLSLCFCRPMIRLSIQGSGDTSIE